LEKLQHHGKKKELGDEFVRDIASLRGRIKIGTAASQSFSEQDGEIGFFGNYLFHT
jgi:hypothetical protein